jgi:hypothetical protein
MPASSACWRRRVRRSCDPRARRPCLRPSHRHAPRRRSGGDPRARSICVSVGGNAPPRATTAFDARGRSDRESAGGDGRLYRSLLSVPCRSLGGRGGTCRRSGRVWSPTPGRGGRCSARATRARPRASRRSGSHLAEARSSHSRRVGERVRLHPYFTERVLTHSSFLSELAPVASSHHERLDGSGYHRGLSAAMLTQPARLLAAADAYHAMTEARPHRTPLSPALAAETCGPPPGRLGRSLVSKRCQLTPVCAWPRVGERRQLLIAGSNRQHVVRLLALNEPATTRLEAEKPHV